MSRLHLIPRMGALLLFTAIPSLFAESVIPGVSSSTLEPELKGLALLEEMNCAGCHTSDPATQARFKMSPRLSEIGSRVNPRYIESFISAPHAIKPGTTMPDVLANQKEEDRKQTAKAITHFLLSVKKSEFSLQAPDAVAASHGKRLFSSRGCAFCHSARDENGIELPSKNSVPLGALDRKYSFKSLLDFLRQPHVSRPSGRMPDLRLSGQDLERIVHYLLQDTRVPGSLSYTLHRGSVWEGLESDKVKAERAGLVNNFALESLGKIQQHSAIQYEGWINIKNKGRYSFFLTMNGGSLLIDGTSVIQQDPSDRRGVKKLEGSIDLAEGWRKIQATYFHTGREAQFSFEMQGPGFERKPIPSAMLSISNTVIPELEPVTVDAELATQGRKHFASLGCANCHNDLQVTPTQSAPLFSKLDSSKGCLSGEHGIWPHFDLNAEQRGLIAKALPRAENDNLTDKQRLSKTLVAFNCIACHERAGLGSIAPERLAMFSGTQEALGDQGRLPPPLTHVGAKLTPEWMSEVLLRGKRQRGYLDASMPQFGEANVGHLVQLFGKVDELEAAPVAKPAEASLLKAAGRELVGTSGFSCISCHDFNGQRSGVGALDIVYVTERVKKSWFHLYMRQPRRFHPTVIMPDYWPDGESTRPAVLQGDTGQQIEALWSYLEDGVRAKKPVGLSRQSNELRVGDVAEICRGRGPAGYRGIGVGYPERLNLAFSSEEMSLRTIWKGEFANVDLGSFSPRGSESVTFPPGIPFYRLKSMEDNWPYKGKTNYTFPQDQGYQFRGYHLDALRRPTFNYMYGDIAVSEFFEDVRGADGKAYFKRTFNFEAPTAQTQYYFRAAAGKKITAQSERQFSADQLQLRISGDYKGLVRDGNPGEILIPLTLPKGRSTLTLEYQW